MLNVSCWIREKTQRAKILSQELIYLREGDKYLNNAIKCFKYFWQVYTRKNYWTYWRYPWLTKRRVCLLIEVLKDGYVFTRWAKINGEKCLVKKKCENVKKAVYLETLSSNLVKLYHSEILMGESVALLIPLSVLHHQFSHSMHLIMVIQIQSAVLSYL